MRIASRSKLRNHLMGLVAATIGFLFTLVLVEFGVRMFFGTALRYQYDEDVLYRPVPNQRGFPSVYYVERATVNSFGMRGREIDSSVKLRFLVVGDSHAFGVGLKDDETLSAQLEQQLQRKYGPNIAIANGGVPGYGLYQVVGLLKSQLSEFRPQGVILLYALGDVERQRPTAEIQASYRRHMFLQWLAAYHVLKVLYIETLARFNVQAYGLPTTREASQLPLDTRFETLWAIEQKNFEALYNLTQQAHVQLIIIGHSPIKEDKEYVKQQLRRFSSDHGIPLFEYFRNLTDPAYYIPRDGHYSGLYYKQLVMEFFKQKFDQLLVSPEVDSVTRG